jgi:hypothetical protein
MIIYGVCTDQDVEDTHESDLFCKEESARKLCRELNMEAEDYYWSVRFIYVSEE